MEPYELDILSNRNILLILYWNNGYNNIITKDFYYNRKL
jgi:hypothetical protein